MKCKLGELSDFIMESVSFDEASVENYVSTESMIADRGGITEPSALPKSGSVRRYRPGDVLISNIRPYFKKIWRATRTGTCSNDVLVIRSNGSCNPAYLYYVLSSNDFFNYMTATSKGTKMPRGDKEAIMDYEIDLPSMEQQEQFTSTMSKIDDLIWTNSKINDYLVHFGQLIFNRYQKNAFIMCTVGDLSEEIICGKTPSTSVRSYYGSDIPFITIPDMHNHPVITKTERMLSKEGAESQLKKIVPRHSVCVSCIATPGLVSITTEASQTNQQINSIICKQNVSPFYIYYLMNSLKSTIINLGSGGSATLNLNKTQFSSIPICIIGDNELKSINLILEPVFNYIEHNNRIIHRLIELRNIILTRLIS